MGGGCWTRHDTKPSDPRPCPSFSNDHKVVRTGKKVVVIGHWAVFARSKTGMIEMSRAGDRGT